MVFSCYSRVFLIAFLCVIGSHSNAQVSDALKGRLRFHLGKIPENRRSQVYFQKAYHFFISDEYDSAIVYTGKYERLPNKDPELLNYSRFFRANSFLEKNFSIEAKINFKKITHSFPLLPAVRSKQANLYLAENSYDHALELFLELKELQHPEHYAIVESSLDHNIGLCYMYLEEYGKSEQFLIQALDQQVADKDTTRIIASYTALANLFYTQYLDEEAIPYFEKAYALAHQTSNFELLGKTTLNMAVVEENREDLAKSLAYRKEYDRWKDSSNNQEKIWEIAQIEKRHLAREKQHEIGLLKQENVIKSKERNAILTGGIILVLILALIIYMYWQKVKSNRLIASQRESLDRLNAFKNRLFSIVSHDLRSSVNGLRTSTKQLQEHTAQNNDPALEGLIQQQGAMANATFGLLDNLLNWALLQSDQLYFHRENVSLHRLVPQVTLNYLPLLNQKNIVLDVDIPKTAKILGDVDSLKIVLRNVLDNAIKFTPEHGTITIRGTIAEGTCILSITDSGKGMSEEQLQRVIQHSSAVSKENDEFGTGLGIRLCSSFVAKNEGVFEMKSKLGVGTTVIISLPKA